LWLRSLKKKINRSELARSALQVDSRLNKSLLAKVLGISRDSLYEKLKRPIRDEIFKEMVIELMQKEPYYGHRRLAYNIGCNIKKTYRIMKLFDLRCRFRRKRFNNTKNQPQTNIHNIPSIPNILQNQTPTKPNQYWSGDFTYIPYKHKFIYLAIQKDLFTREAVGVNVHLRHTEQLVSTALIQALEQCSPPELSHSDQGSEYNAKNYLTLLKEYEIQPSMSTKASPWENGYSEGFFSTFKLEFGNPNRFENEAELICAIYQWMRYYNQERIHTAIKTSPVKFRQMWEQKQAQQKEVESQNLSDRV
jgi:putative transposase